MEKDNLASMSTTEERVVEKLSSNKEQNETQEENIAQKGARYIFYALAFLLPIWMLPTTSFPVEMNKAYLAYILIIAAFVAWLVGGIKDSKIAIPKSAFLFILIIVVAVWGASAIFSQSTHISFIGLGYETGTFSAIMIASIAALLASILFQNTSYALRWFLILLSSSVVVFLFQALHLFGVTLFFKDIFSTTTSNLIGGWNTFGIFSGLIILLVLMLLDVVRIKYFKIFLYILLAVSLTFLAIVNFSTLWWILGIFLVTLLSYLFTSRRGYGLFFATSMIVLFVVIFFILADGVVAKIPTLAGVTFLEVRPSWGSTIEIAKYSIKENPILGSGPNTFMYDWMKWKPQSINDTLFWSTRFSAGVGLIPSYAASVGVFGFLSIVALLLTFIGYGFRTLVRFESSSTHDLLVSSFFIGAYLWVVNIFYAPNFIILLFAFIVSGIFVAMNVKLNFIKNAHINLFQNSGQGFISVVLMILILILSIGSLFTISQKYASAYSFQKGLDIFNEAGDVDLAEEMILRAVSFNDQDRYQRALSEINLSRLKNTLSQDNLSPEELRLEFQGTLASAINHAQAASKLNDVDPLNWMMLGKIYEAIIPFKVLGSVDFANNVYEKAIARDPINPEPVLGKARVAFAISDFDGARELLDNAIALKSDHAPTRFLLAKIEAQAGNIKKAIAHTKDASILAPNDLGILFQLGLLYYQDGDFNNAKLALERAVLLTPSYSNARYFLGLIYDLEGRKQDAILQFEIILSLNPGHPEVLRILSNLREQESALLNIKALEDREVPPVE